MSFSYLLENFYFKYKIETKLLNDSAVLEVQIFLSRISWFIVSNGLGESLRTVSVNRPNQNLSIIKYLLNGSCENHIHD